MQGKLAGYPGVDVQSHGKNVFLPGTRRPSYDGLGYTVEQEDLAALLDGGDPEGAEEFAHWVAEHRQSSNRDPFPEAQTWDEAAPDERQAAYLQGVLRNLHQKVATTAPGNGTGSGRNTAVYDAALAAGNYVAGAGLDEGEATRVLLDASVVNGYVSDDGEAAARASIRSGLRNGKARPCAVPPDRHAVTVLDGLQVDTATGEVVGAQEETHDGFWDAREGLRHLRDSAVALRAAPWAVLGVALARVVVATPPAYVLPALVGSEASLNLFLAVVGASGDGKGAATGAATDALGVGHVATFPVGSGEGLTQLFVKRTREGIEQHTQALLATVAEVDTLAALSSRQGSTIQPVLRQAYMGEEFGFGYADPTKRLVVRAHQYRLSLIVGVQPARAGGLLDDRDGGTPQRFLWLPSVDRRAPDVPPEAPRPRRWEVPPPPEVNVPTGRFPLPVCSTARQAVDAARLARLRGEGEALDGHALLTRLKVAAALGLLDGRAEVGEEDWQLAGTVMAVSDRTRAGVEAGLQTAQRKQNHARAVAEADRQEVVTDRAEARAVKRVAERLRRQVARAGQQGVSHADLRRKAGRDRHLFDDAIAELVEAGRITVEEVAPDEHGRGGHGRRYSVQQGSR